MTANITRFLTPVIRELDNLAGRYTEAHGEVTAAHGSQAGGWFGEIPSASSSFLNAVEWQLRQLKEDQEGLAASLLDYQTSLHQIIAQAKHTDQMIANRFRSIENQLDQMGR